jgi:predicted alpha/beta superfamily hydrolase
MLGISKYHPLAYSFLFVLLLSSCKIFSTEKVELPQTEVRHLQSRNNGVHYRLYIALPSTFDARKSYPCVLLLDADYSFPLAKQIGDHLSERKKIAEIIYVGIAYDGPPNYKLSRTRDYTPTFVATGGYGPEFQNHSGGAEKFCLFIRDELIPFLKIQFQVTSSTLVGHSFGGLFVLWASIQKNAPFDSVISVSPSLWYDHGFLLKWVKRNRAKLVFSNQIRISMWIGDKENQNENKMVDDLNKFYSLIKAIPNVLASSAVLKEEDHDSVFPSALSKGLRQLFGL